MRLGLKRGPKVGLEIAPAVLRPTESLSAEVTFVEPLDGIRDARVELGYVNSYSYRWAGRRDAVVRYDENLLGPVSLGVNDGGAERTTQDWVGVLAEELPVGAGGDATGRHEVALRIPSWAPGSSSIVRWVVRLRAERDGGRDVELEQELRVLAPPPANPPENLKHQRVDGDSTDIVVDTDGPWFLAGEQVRGSVTITPAAAVPEADLAVSLQRIRDSHPLERTPGAGDVFNGRKVDLDKHLELPVGVPTSVPFAIDLPADADPTSSAVHSSTLWYVQARIMYKGFSHGIERVRREFIVCTAE
jgi:hypothetical protein